MEKAGKRIKRTIWDQVVHKTVQGEDRAVHRENLRKTGNISADCGETLGIRIKISTSYQQNVDKVDYLCTNYG